MDDPRRLAINRYLEKTSRSIPGWLEPADGRTLQELSALQHAHGLTADLLEIGAYVGRSAILLGYLLRPGERLFVCDTFEDQPPPRGPGKHRWTDGKRHYPGLTQAAFEKNYRKHHALGPEILRCPSAGIGTDARVRPPFRIVHVDGSHEPAVMAQDIATARALLAPGGIAVFEDDHSLHNPAVAPAVQSALERGELHLICMTPWKLYASPERDVLDLRAGLARWAAASPDVAPVTADFLGRPALLLYPRPRRAGPWRRLERKTAGRAPGSRKPAGEQLH
jgi:hypothetical protein